MPVRNTGTRLQNEIRLALGSEPDLLLMRNSVGVAEHVREDGSVYKVPYGLGPGTPDLVGILKGRWFALEVKDGSGRPSAQQVRVHKLWERFGTHVIVVRSVADAITALQTARGLW